jgi:hypothetical protein
MDDAPRILVKPASGVSPEEALDARARAWAFVFQCWHAKKNAASEEGGEDDAKEINGRTAKAIIQED